MIGLQCKGTSGQTAVPLRSHRHQKDYLSRQDWSVLSLVRAEASGKCVRDHAKLSTLNDNRKPMQIAVHSPFPALKYVPFLK